MITVSIVIPVYNVASYVEKCLISALSQTYNNIEFVIVNDCSTDDSMDIIYDIISKSCRRDYVKILSHKKNLGLSEARNTGIRNSVGDYLYFLDSDDYIASDAIELLVSLVDKYHSDFVVSKMKLFGLKSGISYLHLNRNIFVGNSLIASLFAESKWDMMACNKLVSRRLILDNNLFFYPGIYHEDELWSLKLALVANSMAVSYSETYFYRINASSITSHVTKKHIEDMCIIIDESMKLLSCSRNICLYSRVRSLYLRILTNLNTDNFASNFKEEILEKLSYLYKPLAKEFYIFSPKSIVKYMMCLIPIRLLFLIVKCIRIWA